MDFEAGDGRAWSWAASPAEATARHHEANALVGQRIRQIHYYTIDYEREDRCRDLIGTGPRLIDDEAEWTAPTWLYDGFDAMDFGMEIATDSGATFSLTWDLPGEREGIGLQPVAMLGSGVTSDADVAIWDVGERAASWVPLFGQEVTRVELHYVPWDEARGSLWCRRITFHSQAGRVEVILGDSEKGALVPSSDNVAVLHPGVPLPVRLRSHG